MKCPECHSSINDWKATICMDCQKPLYYAEIRSDCIHLCCDCTLNLHLYNKGLDPFKIEAVLLADETLNTERPTVKPCDGIALEFLLPSNFSEGYYPLTIRSWIQGRKIELPFLDRNTIQLLQRPILGVPANEITINQSGEISFDVLLENSDSTHCWLEKIDLIDGAGNNLCSQAYHTRLGKDIDNIQIQLTLEKPLSPGEHPVKLRLSWSVECSTDRKTMEKPIKLIYYQHPKVSLEKGAWTAAGHRYTPINIGSIIHWRSPVYTTSLKRLRLRGDRTRQPESKQGYFADKAFARLITRAGKFNQEEVSFVNEIDVKLELAKVPPDEVEKKAGREQSYTDKTSLIVATHENEQEYDVWIERFIGADIPWCLCLDFGTTNSCVAIAKPDSDGKFTSFPLKSLDTAPIDFSEPPWLFPSVVNFDHGLDLVGQEAARYQKDFEPIKSLMFRPDLQYSEREKYGGYAFKIMNRCLERTLEWLIDQPKVTQIFFRKIVLAVPTSFPILWKEHLRDICKAAAKKVYGNCEVLIVEESMAALRFYLSRIREEDRQCIKANIIIICDFGGGSTDITILQKQTDENSTGLAPILHGGMRNFASYNLDQLIQKIIIEELVDSNVYEGDDQQNTLQARDVKENLHDRNSFNETLRRHYDLFGDVETGRVWERIHKELEQTILDRFGRCFKDMINRIKHIFEDKKESLNVLLLLAGNGSLLSDFSKHVKNAWYRAAFEEIEAGSINVDDVKIELINEPKRCVAFGGFLSTQAFSTRPEHLHNIIPEDILIPVDPQIANFNSKKYFSFGETKFLVLFEAGQPLDENHKAIIRSSLAEMGIRQDIGRVEFDLYTCMPGDEPELYRKLYLGERPFGTLGEMTFTYSPEQNGSLIKAEFTS